MADAKSRRTSDRNADVHAMYAPFPSPALPFPPTSPYATPLIQHDRTADESAAPTAPTSPAIPHIDIEQSATGGIKGTTETRTLDWTWRPHSDWLFGDVMARSRFTTVGDVRAEARGKRDEDAEFMAEGWVDERDGEVTVVESFADNEGRGWTAW